MQKILENEVDIKKEQDFKEYIKTINLEEFLCFTDIEKELDVNVDSILGTPNDIYTLLKDALFHENFLLEDVEKRVAEMERSIEFYRSYILADRKIKTKKDKKFKKIYLTEHVGSDLEEIVEENDDEFEEENLDTEILPSDLNQIVAFKKPKSSTIVRKTINGFAYVGFNPKELTELAGFQETPLLLNNLTAKMGFKSSFLRYWSPIIRSEASCAILQDSFWWFFLKYFKKDPQLENDAYKYFCRISDSFVALFMSVDSSIRDRFFGNYARFLSQAIYMAFYKGFSDSRMLLNDDFKNELCNTVYEWILGVKPIPETYKDWEIAPDIDLTNITDIKVTSTGEILQKITNLEKILKNLGEKNERKVASVKFDQAVGTSSIQKPTSPVKTEKKLINSVEDNKIKFINSFYEKNQSHTAGEGSVIERYSFQLKGQSILIGHYLKIHDLQTEMTGIKISRLQIAKQPSSNEITYKNLIDESLERQKTLEIEYKKATSQSDIDLKKRTTSSQVKFTQNTKPNSSNDGRNSSAARNRNEDDIKIRDDNEIED